MIPAPHMDFGFMKFAEYIINKAAAILIKMTLLILICSCSASYVNASVYYVKTGGSTATNCTGLADAVYDGAGTGEACSFNHINWALEINGNTNGAMAGGDMLVIVDNNGGAGWRIGCLDADCKDSLYNITQGICSPSFTYDCYPNPVPDGTALAHTKIYGCTTTGCSNPASRPTLYGVGSIKAVINLINSDYVDIQDLDITDGGDYGAGHSRYPTSSAGVNYLGADNGIHAQGASNILLTNLRIHGLSSRGIFMPNSNIMTLDNTIVSYNSFIGLDNDSNGACTTCGVTEISIINGSEINYNGCVEDNPGYGTIKQWGCYSQDQSGYGDGIGMANTGGAFVITDSEVSHNVSDGVDLLYLNRGSYSGGTVTIKRSLFEGNAGNQVKVPFSSTILDSVLVGNCGYFKNQSFTCTSAVCGASFNNCRAEGNALVLAANSGDGSSTPKFLDSTLISNGDVGIQTGGTCTAGTDLIVKNNILRGGRQWNDDTANNGSGGNDTSVIQYDASGTCNTDFIETNNLCYGWKEGSSACNGSGSTDTADPLFSGTLAVGPTTYYTAAIGVSLLTLQSTSTARSVNGGSADETVSGSDSVDYNNFDRGAAWDNGAIEYGSSPGGDPTAVCGNNDVEATEACDDGNVTSEDGCSSVCTVESGYGCSGDPSTCSIICGNSLITSPEGCDDGDVDSGDGCSSSCAIESGYSCTGTPSVCTALCGNGSVGVSEECDDGNVTNSDGCSAICQIEVAGLEKLLLFTETDTGGVLSVETHKVTMNGINHAATANLKGDYGASHFGNFTHRFKVTINACNDNGAGEDGGAGLWALTATSRANLYAQEVANDGLTFSLGCLSSSARYTWKLYSAENQNIDTYEDSAPSLVRYFEIYRSGTTVTAKIYSDIGYTTLLDTLTVTGTATAYRYLDTANSYNDGVSGTSFSGYVENIDLDAAAVPALGCEGTTTQLCDLLTSDSGTSSGTCAGSGSCSYLCTNGVWGQTLNTCQAQSSSQVISIRMTGTTITGCTIP